MFRLLVILLSLTASGVQGQTGVIQKLAEVRHAPLNEMSGIVKSKRFSNLYWVHNDSGDSARLFGINAKGDPVFPHYVRDEYHGSEVEEGKQPWPGLKILQAANLDWEDIAVDRDHIYIGDIGNNGNARRDLGVYVLNEPNPTATEAARILSYLPIRYPEQEYFPGRVWHFDSEAMFVADEKLYFITRHRQPRKLMEFESGANLYRLDTRHTDQVNDLTLVDSNAHIMMASGADLSPDGNHLAVLSYVALWVFDRPEDDQWLSGKARMLPLDLQTTRQVEAVTWAGNHMLLITNEQREIFRVNLSDIPEAETPQATDDA